MSADTSAASDRVPPVVLATACGIRREKALRVLAVSLAAVLSGQGALLGLVVRQPARRLYVSDATVLSPSLITGDRFFSLRALYREATPTREDRP